MCFGAYENAHSFVGEQNREEIKFIHIELAQEVSFQQGLQLKDPAQLPEGCSVVIDASASQYIAHIILELIRQFRDVVSKDKTSTLELIRL